MEKFEAGTHNINSIICSDQMTVSQKVLDVFSANTKVLSYETHKRKHVSFLISEVRDSS